MEKKHHHRNGRENPSFSSTLLDAIYRSLDEEEELVLYKETSSRKKQTSSTTTASMRNSSVKKSMMEEEEDKIRKACMIEKWMEKKVSEKVVYRRNSLPDRKTIQNDRYPSKVFHSASSSSDSSCGELFSSSEAESWYGSKSSQRPKPIRTNAFEKSDRRPTKSYEQEKQGGSAGGGGFNKTKSKALKIYAELKKAKQPISPGGRLSSFLNSLFTTSSGHLKKKSTKSSSDRVGVVEERKLKSTQTSTCSSVSSFSRSCLSKTPSTRSKQSNGVKRSVRFYPVSVIVDEDSRPCGHKCLQEDEPKLIKLNEEFKFHLMEKNRRIEEAARDLLKNYREKTTDLIMRDQDDETDDEDDDDDAASDASSDLFELDNLGAIGIQRYREELPVYETTYLEKNRAIANGFM